MKPKEKRSPAIRPGAFFRCDPAALELAGSAANRLVAEADIAAATGFKAAAQTVAATLNDIAAGFVTAQTGNAHSVLCVFTFANAAGKIALTDGDAVERAAHSA